MQNKYSQSFLLCSWHFLEPNLLMPQWSLLSQYHVYIFSPQLSLGSILSLLIVLQHSLQLQKKTKTYLCSGESNEALQTTAWLMHMYNHFTMMRKRRSLRVLSWQWVMTMVISKMWVMERMHDRWLSHNLYFWVRISVNIFCMDSLPYSLWHEPTFTLQKFS